MTCSLLKIYANYYSGRNHPQRPRHVHGLHINRILPNIPCARNLLRHRQRMSILSSPLSNIHLFRKAQNARRRHLRLRQRHRRPNLHRHVPAPDPTDRLRVDDASLRLLHPSLSNHLQHPSQTESAPSENRSSH